MDTRAGCQGCRNSEPLPFTFTMAFHPIVDVEREKVWGYEALIRGAEGQSAYSILNQVDEGRQYRFDQACRVKAIELAARLFPHGENIKLSINFLPNAVYEPAACLRTSLAAAKTAGFPRENIMFEFTEGEKIEDVGHVERIIDEYRSRGFMTAIDDFGAGYSGLNLISKFQPDLLKIDMDLVRDIDRSPAKQVIIAGIVWMARSLGIIVLAEGIESEAEEATLRAAGIALLQGYRYAKPGFEVLPPVRFGVEAKALKVSA